MRTRRSLLVSGIVPVLLLAQLIFPTAARAALVVDEVMGSLSENNPDYGMRATDVVEGSNGSVYVVDNAQHQIHIYSNGIYQDSFGGQGSEPGQLYFPESIATYGDTLYVLDASNARVSSFTLSGGYLGSFGKYGNVEGEFLGAARIAVDSSGNVWVTDRQAGDVQQFSSGGTYLSRFDTLGFPGGGFDSLSGIAFAPDGNMYLTDFLGGRVVKVSTSGTFIAEVGLGDGTTGGYFDAPSDVTVTPNGDIYVVDPGAHHEFPAQVFDSNGVFKLGFGDVGTKLGYPSGISSNSMGEVYATDTANEGIVRYADQAIKIEVEEQKRNFRNGKIIVSFVQNYVKTCSAGLTGVVRVGNQRFNVDGATKARPGRIEDFILPVSKEGRKAITEALNSKKKKAFLDATIRLECPGTAPVEKVIEVRID